MDTTIKLTNAQINKVERALKAIEEVRVAANKKSSNHVNWYLEDSSNLCLMDGESHNDRVEAQHGMVIQHFNMWAASGGGW